MARARCFRLEALGAAFALGIGACTVDGREVALSPGPEPFAPTAGAAGGSSSGAGGAAGGGGTGGGGGAPASAPDPTMIITLAVNGVSCGEASDCESNHCGPTQSGSLVCCREACGAEQRCSNDGASCVDAVVLDPGAPLFADGEACAAGEQCSSGYCRASISRCAPDPCAGALVGKYCDRGAQCEPAGACAFTGMGMVAAGSAHTCVIVTNGGLRCFGDNADGQLGARLDQPMIGDTADEVPNLVPDLLVSFGERRAVQVTGGNFHTCALLDDGNVRCFGSNMEGQLNPVLENGDVGLPPGETAIQIDAGAAHTCAVLASGGLSCWGFNNAGQLGAGHALPLEATGPVAPIVIADGVRQVACGSTFTCAVRASGALTCWGNGQNGVLGYAEQADRFEPLGDVDVGGAVSYVAAGSRATCVVMQSGSVRCWGDNDNGILGYGHDTGIGLTETPAQAGGITLPEGRTLGGDVPLGSGGAVQVEVNTDSGHVCVRFSGGALRCFGDNNDGSLGYGHEEHIGDDETPAQAAQLSPNQLGGDVPIGRSVLALASGGRCAVLNDRSVICWGRNTSGQLGMPALFPAGTPDLTPAELLSSGIGPVRFE